MVYHISHIRWGITYTPGAPSCPLQPRPAPRATAWIAVACSYALREEMHRNSGSCRCVLRGDRWALLPPRRAVLRPFTTPSYDWLAHSSIPGLINFGVVSNFWPGQMVQLWPFLCLSLGGHTHTSVCLLDTHLGESSWDLELCIGSVLIDANKQFSKTEMSSLINLFFFSFSSIFGLGTWTASRIWFT